MRSHVDFRFCVRRALLLPSDTQRLTESFAPEHAAHMRGSGDQPEYTIPHSFIGKSSQYWKLNNEIALIWLAFDAKDNLREACTV
ncbi:hypothetical protein ACV22V_22995 [Burkholderia sp. AW33-5]